MLFKIARQFNTHVRKQNRKFDKFILYISQYISIKVCLYLDNVYYKCLQKPVQVVEIFAYENKYM